MATRDHKRKVAAQTGLYLIIIAAIVVVANLLSAGVYHRFDTTKAERYTLSQGSGRLVRSLKEPVYVEAYVKTGMAQLDAFVRDLTDLLKEYERAGDGKFKYTVIEPTTDEERKKAADEGLQEQPFIDASATGEDQASVTQGYMGLVFKYGGEKAVIPFLPPDRGEGLEFWITNKIREISDKNDNKKHRIGVVTGKDELKLTDTNLLPKQGQQAGPSWKQVLESNFPFYALEELDLKDGAEPIDAALDGIIITQPQKDYSEQELRRIDEFLMRGGKALAVFASAVSMKPQDASMQATLNLHGLDKLLTGYGIEMKKDAVFDFGDQFAVTFPAQNGMGIRRHPGIVRLVHEPGADPAEQTLDMSFPAFFRMNEIVAPFPSSLELLRDKQPEDVKLEAVARTTPVANAVTTETVDMKLTLAGDTWTPKPPFAQRIIAATAEGKLKSAFAGKPAEGVAAPERAPSASRVFVMSSSEFLTNPFAFHGNGPELGGQFAMFGGMGGDKELLMFAGPYTKVLQPTLFALKNTLDWLSNDSDLIAVSAKLLGDPSLTYSTLKKPELSENPTEEELRKVQETMRKSRKDLQRNVQWSLTLGIPLLFGLFGVLRWMSREKKRGLKAA